VPSLFASEPRGAGAGSARCAHVSRFSAIVFVVRNLTASEWWEPSRPDRRLHGVLFEEAGRGWVLKLDGNFEKIELDRHLASEGPITVPLTSPSEFPVLCGITGGGKLLTLFNCQVMAATWPLFGNSGQLVVWPTILAYDVHFENLDDFRLTSLSVRYSNLDAWAATSGFSIDLGSSDNYSVSTSPAEPICCFWTSRPITSKSKRKRRWNRRFDGIPAPSSSCRTTVSFWMRLAPEWHL
jgi:hypothetical protein